MYFEKERLEIIEFGKNMIEENLTTGTSGNISVYDADRKLMAISPSGIGYFETNPEDIVVMTLDGEVVSGDRKPSSEWGLHAEIYKVKPNCKAIVHTHSMYCTVFASLRQPLRAVHYVIGDANTSIVPCADYETYGSMELAKRAAETIGKSEALLLANHGMIACGNSVKSAFGLAMAMEYCAELEYRCRCIGTPHILPDEEMDKVITKFKSYGQ